MRSASTPCAVMPVGVLCDRSLPDPHAHLARLRCERGRLRRGDAAHHHEHARHVLFGLRLAWPQMQGVGASFCCVGASGFSGAHICGTVAAGMRVRAVSDTALGEENAHTAAASANAIATATRGQTKERARGRSTIERALLAANYH
eukprot:scaffold86390_cov53-Phaeocystis_antarctica.AAC.2